MFQDLVLISSTAFWDAYLKNNPVAKMFLAEGEFEKRLGQEGNVGEEKQRVKVMLEKILMCLLLERTATKFRCLSGFAKKLLSKEDEKVKVPFKMRHFFVFLGGALFGKQGFPRFHHSGNKSGSNLAHGIK